jgi:DeoR family transcriptional regulator, catabolite repression regulator
LTVTRLAAACRLTVRKRWSEKGVLVIALTPRQEKIAEIVHQSGPITGEQIAERLNVTRAALRSDLAILVMSGILDARPKVGYFFTGKSALSMLAQEIALIKVRDIQSVPVVVTAETAAYDAIVTMFLEDVGTVFVVEQGATLVGVVSRKDLLKACMGNSGLQKIPVKVLMTATPKLVVTTPEEPILIAAKKIIDSEVDSLPVVRSTGSAAERNYEVVGRLTKTNLARLLVDFGEGKRG